MRPALCRIAQVRFQTSERTLCSGHQSAGDRPTRGPVEPKDPSGQSGCGDLTSTCSTPHKEDTKSALGTEHKQDSKLCTRLSVPTATGSDRLISGIPSAYMSGVLRIMTGACSLICFTFVTRTVMPVFVTRRRSPSCKSGLDLEENDGQYEIRMRNRIGIRAGVCRQSVLDTALDY